MNAPSEQWAVQYPNGDLFTYSIESLADAQEFAQHENNERLKWGADVPMCRAVRRVITYGEWEAAQ